MLLSFVGDSYALRKFLWEISNKLWSNCLRREQRVAGVACQLKYGRRGRGRSECFRKREARERRFASSAHLQHYTVALTKMLYYNGLVRNTDWPLKVRCIIPALFLAVRPFSRRGFQTNYEKRRLSLLLRSE